MFLGSSLANSDNKKLFSYIINNRAAILDAKISCHDVCHDGFTQNADASM